MSIHMYAQKHSWHICLFVKSYGNICLLWSPMKHRCSWSCASACRQSTCRDTPCLKPKSAQRYFFWGTCNEAPMAPTHDTYTQQSPTESIDQHTVDMSDRHSNETMKQAQTNSQGKSLPYGLTPNGFVLPVTSAHRHDFTSYAVHNDARSYRLDLFACMTQTTAAGTCTIRTQPGRPETTHALPQAIQNELSKLDLDAKTQKLHLPSFGVCKQPKSEKKSHFTLHTPHFTLLSISLLPSHSKPHTSHFTLRSSHSKLKLHTPHFTLLTSHCFLHTAHFTLHSSRPTLHTALNLRATKKH